MRIRKLELADVKSVANMVTQLAAHHGDTALCDPSQLETLCLGERPWFDLWVAQQSENLIGYFALTRTGQLQFSRPAVDLHHLLVVKQARGQGIGRRLVQASIALAKEQGAHYMTVGAMPDNKAAQLFYEALRFETRHASAVQYRLILTG